MKNVLTKVTATENPNSPSYILLSGDPEEAFYNLGLNDHKKYKVINQVMANNRDINCQNKILPDCFFVGVSKLVKG